MLNAIRVYSPENGFLSETVNATDIKSYAHARKIGPFVDNINDKKQVYWVNWGTPKENGCPRICHFKHFPKRIASIANEVKTQISEFYREKKSDNRHKKAQECILRVLNELILEKKHLPWNFKDDSITDFNISGDFLAGAIAAHKEFSIHTPFKKEYHLDLAIVGKTIRNKQIILAGIEIEYTHRFDFLKAMICKSIGFPLISINIEEIPESNITPEWARSVLMETTANTADGFRRNYIYIHRTLLPVYIDIPRELVPVARHQYIIFSKELDKLLHCIKILQKDLNLSDRQVLVQKVTATNSTTSTEIKNAGELASENWEKYSAAEYIKLTIDKPISKSGDLYYFHLILSMLCNAHFNALVGYKYEPGHSHWEGAPLIWEIYNRENKRTYKVAPKRLSEPVIEILEYLAK